MSKSQRIPIPILCRSNHQEAESCHSVCFLAKNTWGWIVKALMDILTSLRALEKVVLRVEDKLGQTPGPTDSH
eukprot:2524866-Amphidinium_carterae.1